MIRIFVGYDEGEKVAYYVLCESIRKYSSLPVSIVPVSLNNIHGCFNRERVNNQSTEFAFSRFIVPYLCGYEGWSIFMDCDMFLRADIAEVWNMRSEEYAIMCCQHDYVSKQNIKFRGAMNQPFDKKNWASFMLINNKRCGALTPEYVNTASGLDLHQFKWLSSSDEIGNIPLEWNWLVGEYDYNPDAKNAHFTLGGPYFKDSIGCDYSAEWFDVYREMSKIHL